MARIARQSYLTVGTAVLVAVTAGCSAILGAPVDGPAPAAPVPVTVRAEPSMLVVTVGPGGMSQLVRRVVTATARPREDLEVLEPAERGRALLASNSPAPVRVLVPGRPARPGNGASSYQLGQYRHKLTHWQVQLAAAKRTVAAQTKATVLGWTRSLRIQMARRPSDGSAGRLPGDCALAADAVTGLVNEDGAHFTRRTLLLSVANLSGMPPAGELDGDDVIVVTSYLPSAAAASAAQLNLLAAGASFAAVLGPEATPAQVEHLVSASLSGHAVSEVMSGRAPFSNDSAVLQSAAARALAPIVAQLRRPGATGVVNGFASAPGSPRHNQVLSQRRALAVAAYLEARGVPRSALLVVGHGASNLVAAGSSGGNRRVVVVVQEASS